MSCMDDQSLFIDTPDGGCSARLRSSPAWWVSGLHYDSYVWQARPGAYRYASWHCFDERTAWTTNELRGFNIPLWRRCTALARKPQPRSGLLFRAPVIMRRGNDF